jgi:hypothetical protein
MAEQLYLSRISRAEALCVTLQDELRQCEDVKDRLLSLEAEVKTVASSFVQLEARVAYAINTLPRAADYKKRGPVKLALRSDSSSSSSSTRDEESASSSSSEDEGPKARGRNMKWTDAQRDAIMAGAAQYADSYTKWEDILAANEELFRGRTGVNLKDKYRTILRQMAKAAVAKKQKGV